jgi:hypothetical protein
MMVKINLLNLLRLITNTHFKKIDIIIAINMWFDFANTNSASVAHMLFSLILG